MPKYQNVNVTCPDCGKSFKVKQFTRIDPDTMPKQRQAVENTELFREECPYCHKVHEYPYSFTWRESRNHTKLIYAVNEEDQKEFLDYYDGDDDVRITDDMDDFNEKRVMFHGGYDDRIVEVEKIIVLKGMQAKNPKIERDRFSFTITDDGDYSAVIYGVANGRIREIIPADPVYHRLENDMNQKLTEYDEPTLIVNHDWAEKFMSFAGLDQNEVNDMAEGVSEEEENTHIPTFFDEVEQLEYSDQERDAAQLIIQDFDRIWDDILKENPGKPKLSELDDKYGEVVNAVGDFSMILMNEKKYQECMDILKKINDTTDLSDDYLMYMNNRRDYMECLGHIKGFDAKVKYLDDWMKEMPDNPYLYGTEIDVWLGKDPQKALELAKKYVNTPINNIDDSWLLDSCENVARTTGDQELKKQLETAKKKYRNFVY